MALKYLLDEHIPAFFREQMLLRQPDMAIWHVGDPGAPPRGTPDPAMLEWCEAQGCLLVTSNRASMPVHLTDHLVSGRHVPGILVLRPNAGAGRVIEDLVLIWELADRKEYQDLIAFVPLSR